MSWLFSQALVEECSAGICLAGEQSAQLSVMPTQHKFWHKDKTIEPSDHSRFGLTSRVLTDAPWRGIVDVISGGFPCQDISVAGTKLGLEGERSGLWSEFFRIVGEVRPGFVFIENSPALVTRGLDRVLADLASVGFDARWSNLSAAQLGACHERNRAWIVAYSAEIVGPARTGIIEQPRQLAGVPWSYTGISGDRRGRWVEVAREFRRMDDGLAFAVERTEAIGNGQVPIVAATAFQQLAR
jgi:DNA (cytosine-5)-methyltransferase 1